MFAHAFGAHAWKEACAISVRQREKRSAEVETKFYYTHALGTKKNDCKGVYGYVYVGVCVWVWERGMFVVVSNYALKLYAKLFAHASFARMHD